jgi:GT2 family glycosyltransferase/glycosyltransferase involved in cell wall biosynthesis
VRAAAGPPDSPFQALQAAPQDTGLGNDAGISDERPAVLVTGVYLANRLNCVASIVGNLAATASYRVVQRWAALGGVARDPQVRRVTTAFQMAWVPKFVLINELLADVKLSDFDYVIVADDDIILPDFFLDRFLCAQASLGFCLAQPARTAGSYADHAIAVQEQNTFARETQWVEVGPLVSIHRSVYELVMPFDLTSPMGWGYENIWAYNLWRHGRAMGIIDAFPVDHSVRGSGVNYNPAEAASAMGRMLAERAHLPLDACQRVLRRYPADDASGGRRTRLPADDPARANLARVRAAIDQHALAIGRPCWVLDWRSGVELAAATSEHILSTADVQSSAVLPYLGQSVDVVVVPAGDPAALTEARRVARYAVIQHGPREELMIERIAPPAEASLPSVSILIPTYNAAWLVDDCLAALLPTLPDTCDVEVLVIDDASEDGTRDHVLGWSAHDPRVRFISSPGRRQGFIHACNRGAAVAQGEILVFLNNDTKPLPGWLEPLLRVFADHGDAGAVGGKLLYPDGRLQEAGGLVFSDGSAANAGRGSTDPGAPLYSYFREADYCSAALLATPRRLFFGLGMLDARYAPAYYEDVDYCFKVRAAGRKVYYQPESTVIHLEGATSGSDPRSGVKRFQQKNQVKMFDEWRSVLLRYPQRPEEFNDSIVRKLALPRRRIGTDGAGYALVCSSTLPEFDRESGSRRLLDHISALQENGWTVIFAARNGDSSSRYAKLLRNRGIETHCDFQTLPEILSSNIFDVALIAFWHVAEGLMPLIRQLSPRTRVIVDSVDLHFLRNARRHQRGVGADDEMNRELTVYGTADAVLTVSAEEAEIVQDRCGTAVSLVVPDGEDMELSTVPWSRRRGLLFLGNFRHPPNVEAVSYLCREILPLVGPAVRSDHAVYIVGNDLSDEVRACANGLPNVVMVGWVASVEPYLMHCRVAMAPLLHGAGTKRKVVQALMAGAPTVATAMAVEGLPVQDGQHLLVRDGARDFARGVTRLATDDGLCELLIRRGRAAILSRHSRQASRAALVSAVDAVLR